MKIPISKKEYRLLLDLLYLSDWVINSHTLPGEEAYPAYRILQKKLLSYYKVMEADDLIDYVREEDEYYEKRHYEEELDKKFIIPYENQIFWEMLIGRLAERDVMNALGMKAYHLLSPFERVEHLAHRQDFYAQVFETRGLEALAFVEDTEKERLKH